MYVSVLCISGKWYPHFNPNTDFSDHNLLAFIHFEMLATFAAWSCTTWYYFVYPLSPPFPNDLLPKNYHQSWLFYMVIGSVYLLITMLTWTTMLMVLTTIFIYVFYTRPMIMKDLRGGNGFIQYKNLSSTYRTFEIMHMIMLENLAWTLVPFQVLIFQYGLICNHTLILNWKTMDLTTTGFLVSQFLMFQGLYVLYLSFGGWFYKNSVRILEGWKALKLKNAIEMKCVAKFRRSCRPMYIGYPGVFKVRKVSVLTYCQGLLTGTSRLLVGLRGIGTFRMWWEHTYK